MSALTHEQRPSKKRCPTDVRFVDHYPDENPKSVVDDVTRVLAHVGVFDGLKPEGS